MPTYQYACTACDHRFEAVQSFSDSALTECPECQGKLRKVFSAVGVVFKGSGFYRTDSRGSGTASTAPAKPDAKPSSDSASTPSKSTTDSSSSSSAASTPKKESAA
jgi:putative FmdB family regulatory protein